MGDNPAEPGIGLSLHWPELDPDAETEPPLAIASSSQSTALQQQEQDDAFAVSNLSIDGLIDRAARQYISHLGGGCGSGTTEGGAPNATGLRTPLPAGPLRPGVLPPPTGAILRAKLASTPGAEPKTALNQFCQKVCKRPINKMDVLYSVTSLGVKRYQAMVRVNCFGGVECVGEVRIDPRTAERSAAEKVLEQLVTCAQNGTLAPNWGGGVKIPEPGQPSPVPDTLPQGLAFANSKLGLNMVLGKILKQVLPKDICVYETLQVRGGFQSTLKLPHLPGIWAMERWVSKACTNKRDAELGAAAAALASLLADPFFNALYRAPKAAVAAKIPPGKGGIRGQQDKLTSAAPKVPLMIAVDERAVGMVEVGPATSLSSVRAVINETPALGIPAGFLFNAAGAPVPKDQEGHFLARDFLPQLTVAIEDLRGAARRANRPKSASPCSPRASRSQQGASGSNTSKARLRSRSRSRRRRR